MFYLLGHVYVMWVGNASAILDHATEEVIILISFVLPSKFT